jgi:hypothetical protein
MATPIIPEATPGQSPEKAPTTKAELLAEVQKRIQRADALLEPIREAASDEINEVGRCFWVAQCFMSRALSRPSRIDVVSDIFDAQAVLLGAEKLAQDTAFDNAARKAWNLLEECHAFLDGPVAHAAWPITAGESTQTEKPADAKRARPALQAITPFQHEVARMACYELEKLSESLLQYIELNDETGEVAPAMRGSLLRLGELATIIYSAAVAACEGENMHDDNQLTEMMGGPAVMGHFTERGAA